MKVSKTRVLLDVIVAITYLTVSAGGIQNKEACVRSSVNLRFDGVEHKESVITWHFTPQGKSKEEDMALYSYELKSFSTFNHFKDRLEFINSSEIKIPLTNNNDSGLIRYSVNHNLDLYYNITIKDPCLEEVLGQTSKEGKTCIEMECITESKFLRIAVIENEQMFYLEQPRSTYCGTSDINAECVVERDNRVWNDSAVFHLTANSSGLGAGGIFGIIVGVAATVGLIIFIYFCRRNRIYKNGAVCAERGIPKIVCFPGVELLKRYCRIKDMDNTTD